MRALTELLVALRTSSDSVTEALLELAAILDNLQDPRKTSHRSG